MIAYFYGGMKLLTDVRHYYLSARRFLEIRNCLICPLNLLQQF